MDDQVLREGALDATDGIAAAVRAAGGRAVGGGGSPTVVVVGNTKGGTGKSTLAMHLAVALLRAGRRVGTIDLDGRQGTLSRYVENRRAFARSHGLALASPAHRRLASVEGRQRDESEAREAARFAAALDGLSACEVVVVDTPAGDSHVCRLGHAAADILVTPVNDSFVDIDVLARIDRDRREVLAASPYAQMVWEQSRRRAEAGRAPIGWLVARNRRAHVDARSGRVLTALMVALADRLGFRLVPGLGERVVYRELFHDGLTVLDLPGTPGRRPSHDRARGELADLAAAVGTLAEARVAH